MSEHLTRKEKERIVLQTLIHRPGAFTELPDGFDAAVFETPDYGRLYDVMKTEYLEKSLPVSTEEICLKRARFTIICDDLNFAPNPLNGSLRGAAHLLLRHSKPEPARGKPPHTSSVELSEPFRWKIYDAKEIFEMEIPEQSFLIENLISEESLNFLAGEEGCGKSMLAMNLALSVAIGAEKWLNYRIGKPGKVLYLNNEIAFSDFARRLKTMSGNLPTRGDISKLIVPDEVPALRECWDVLNEECERLRPRLVVVDCLYFTHDRDENDSSQMKQLMRQFIELRNHHKLALLLVHHTKKGARNERMHNDLMRGSNVFGGVTDTVLQIRRSGMDETKRILKPTKFRHVSDENRTCRLLSLNTDTFWFRDEGETDENTHMASVIATAGQQIDIRAIFQNDMQLTRREILDRCRPLGYKYSDKTIDRHLEKLLASGMVKRPTPGVFTLGHLDTWSPP